MNEVVIIDKAEIDGFRTEGSTAVEKARELARSIVDAPSLDTAARFMLAAKDTIKRITKRFEGPKADARKNWKNWCDLESEVIEPYERIEKEILKPAIAKFQTEQERKRREEEQRLMEEAKKREEDQRLKEAAELERTGQKQLADALISAPVSVPPVTVPQPDAPKGVSFKEVWRYRVVDVGIIPREYLCVDEQKLAGVVRALKSETRIPGVEVYSEKIVVGRV